MSQKSAPAGRHVYRKLRFLFNRISYARILEYRSQLSKTIGEIMKKISYLLLLLGLCIISVASAQEEQWMPDPVLRKAVRQELKIDADTPLTKADMPRLLVLASNRVKISEEISDLTGLEYAVRLHTLLLGKHRVRNLRPIANLTNLRFLGFGPGPISDITPLAGLVNLETLGIERNQIVDVSPLANLINLRDLKLAFNQIEDFSPFAGLVNLGRLRVTRNRSSDISMIPTSGLKVLAYDETCNVASIPIFHRIADREYPSISGVWSYVPNKPSVIPRPETSEIKPNAYFDLRVAAAPQTLRLGWAFNQPGSDEAVRLIATGTANIEDAKQRREAILAFNPNAILLVQILYYSGLPARLYPEDDVLRDLYLRDKNGNRIGGEVALLDFTLPETQEFVFDQIRAIKACGLFDGIFFDFWGGNQTLSESRTGRTQAEEYNARDRIIQGARAIIGDDMLILVNTGERKIPRWAEYINGTFMETHAIAVPIEGKDKYHHIGYTRDDLLDIEDTLVWSESNFREPRINVLQGGDIDVELPDSPRNKQWMRTFTTMSLTLSDGYVQYTTKFGKYGPAVYWYPFYDAPLGRPVGEKGQNYKNREGVPTNGLFIREFTNGWAVYNRSGTAQEIELPQEVFGWSSGVEHQRRHTLADLDGEIYLKTIPQVAPGEYPPLYWIDTKTGTLQRLVDTEVKNLVSGVQNATSLTVDTANKKLYWTEKTGNRTGKIQSANLDGRNVQLVRKLTSAPLDLTLDTAGGKLYLSNAWGKIQRMNLDGSNFQPNFITGLTVPQNLVLDTTNRQLYWTEQTGKTSGKIQRANLDGSNVQLVKELTSAPRGMTLDAVNKKLYLSNAWGKIQRMNLDGSNFQPNFITGLASPGQVAVDRVGGKLYWTEKGKLRSADLNDENIQNVITGLGELADLGLGIDSAGEMGVAGAPAAIRTVVEQTQLLANYPNPFNPETWIPYQLSEPAEVKVRIYSVKGILVRTLMLGQTPAGIYQDRSRAAYWDGRNDVGESVASGLYFYTLTAGDFTATRRMLIRK